ncbi:hypothetical protein C8F04DRAFT_1387905 [Mycena alexandri]|uniref:Uncharacterized protein n=1 Tax=Mycena alexandri TaxID=1745969 RepID=A0AAD6TJC3_9AGAR|nr:hypothetical protein C8F04DRAFT_1387905 [Mycena alexandri]
MTETVGTIVDFLQLIDKRRKTREFVDELNGASKEQEQLLSEMDELDLLLRELRTCLSADQSTDIHQQINVPFAIFKTTMEQGTAKVLPWNRPSSTFSKDALTKERQRQAEECLQKFEQFESLLNTWLLLHIQSEPGLLAVCSNCNENSGADIVRERMLCTIASIIKLVDTAGKSY